MGVFHTEGVAALFSLLVVVRTHRLDAYGRRYSKEWGVTRDRRSGARDGGLRLGLQLDRLRRSLGSALGAHWFRAAIQCGLSVGWVELGVGLLAAGTKRAPRPQAGG